MSDKSNRSELVGNLTIVFIVLKLTNSIDWEWKWVLSPIWIALCLFLLI